MIDSPVLSVRIPLPWRPLVAGHEEVTASGDNVGEILESVCHEYPAIRLKLFGLDGQVQSGFVIFLGARNVRELAGLETAIGLEEVMTLVVTGEA